MAKQKQNLTLSLPEDLIKQAKIYAASNDTTLTDLFKSAVEALLDEDGNYEKAKKKQIALLKKGLKLGTKGSLTFTRDSIYERKN